MVYIESPAGVGYSYVDSEEVPEYDEDTTAEDNYLTVLEFFNKFSDLKDNDVFIAGESYAGMYVPYLAHKILIEKKNTQIKLKGILVGNGVTDRVNLGESYRAMGFWHGLVDKNLEN